MQHFFLVPKFRKYQSATGGLLQNLPIVCGGSQNRNNDQICHLPSTSLVEIKMVHFPLKDLDCRPNEFQINEGPTLNEARRWLC